MAATFRRPLEPCFDLVSVALDTSRVPTRHEKGDDVSGALRRRQVQSLCFGVIPYGRLSFLPSFLPFYLFLIFLLIILGFLFFKRVL